jgi:hypothetical protein
MEKTGKVSSKIREIHVRIGFDSQTTSNGPCFFSVVGKKKKMTWDRNVTIVPIMLHYSSFVNGRHVHVESRVGDIPRSAADLLKRFTARSGFPAVLSCDNDSESGLSSA